MISVASLLNPPISDTRIIRHPSSPSSTCFIPSSRESSTLPRAASQKLKMSKDGVMFSKKQIKGAVNFPPFEDLNKAGLQEALKYEVHPIGRIRMSPRHIPYNSEKKDFLGKTGREGFEVFHYEFKVPGDEKIYTVLWDYNVGLVRITPFFKCCKYSKTTPAKMLNLNHGLKEITHSITGGSLAAQGYWMPYSCARAVCATFCCHISGALIPIFGPNFPSICTPTDDPAYGRMTIDPTIIASATVEANSFRQQCFTPSPSSNTLNHSSTSPHEQFQDIENASNGNNIELGRRMRLKRTFTSTSLYNTDTDRSDTRASSPDQYNYSPTTTVSRRSSPGGGWKANNIPLITPTSTPFKTRPLLTTFLNEIPPSRSHTPNLGHRSTASCGASPSPWLSAIPRSVAMPNMPPTQTTTNIGWRKSKRRAVAMMQMQMRDVDTDSDREYEGEESSPGGGSGSDGSRSGGSEGIGAMEKRAAWLLMNLSVADREWGSNVGNEGGFGGTAGFGRGGDSASHMDVAPMLGAAATVGVGIGSDAVMGSTIGLHSDNLKLDDGPRVKRRRATSV